MASALYIAAQNDMISYLGSTSNDMLSLAHACRELNMTMVNMLRLATKAPSFNNTQTQAGGLVIIDICSTCGVEGQVESCISKHELNINQHFLCCQCLAASTDFEIAVCSKCGKWSDDIDYWWVLDGNAGASKCFDCFLHSEPLWTHGINVTE